MNEKDLVLIVDRTPNVLNGLYKVNIYWKDKQITDRYLALETLIQRRGSLEKVAVFLNSKKGFRLAMGESKESFMKYVRMREYADRQPPSIGW